ncbi:MAG: DUF4834 family protein, partial [Muribaculaceae bacterium]|nr:DUF4834 family protein [Muribaculaceae bacterium]
APPVYNPFIFISPMTTFLGLVFLFFIIFYIIVPLVRGALGLRRMRRDWKQQINNFRRAAGFDTPRDDTPAPKPRRKKKIDADTGEYIAFEEIKAEASYTRTTSETSFVAEEQIEDITWEDIK